MDLILVRHGQSEPSSATPDWHLSAQGVWEAARVGERLLGAGITHIVSSPLLRALATAHTIADTLDLEPIALWLDLREGFDHEYRGECRAAVARRFPRAALAADLPDDGWLYPADSREGFVARCHRVLARLMAEFGANDRVLVVTHGGVANYLLHAIIYSPPDAPIWYEMASGAITTIRFVPEHERTDWPLYPAFETMILSLNDTRHLSNSADKY